MGLTIEVLNLGDSRGDASFKVRGRPEGTPSEDPMNAFLILGGAFPILVDAGCHNEEVMTRLGLEPVLTAEHSLEARLACHDLTIDDLGLVVMTHLHVDHAGLLHKIPMTTPVVVNRREMGAAFGGLQGLIYAPEDLHHIVDRMYTPGALRFVDLELSGPQTIAPGIRLEAANGHTDGSLVVYVETDDGTACLCGDLVYEIEGALLERLGQIHEMEPQTSNNYTSHMVAEHAAIKRVLHNARFLQPSHSYWCAVVEDGRVVGRIDGTIPGSIRPI